MAQTRLQGSALELLLALGSLLAAGALRAAAPVWKSTIKQPSAPSIEIGPARVETEFNVDGILEQVPLLDPQYRYLIDARFQVEARPGAPRLQLTPGPEPPGPLPPHGAQERLALALFGAATGPEYWRYNDQTLAIGQPTLAPETFAAYLRLIQSERLRLDLKHRGRLQLLSLLGSGLLREHTPSDSARVISLEQMYRNLKDPTITGGVCSDIHAVLAAVATRLGFDKVGMQSLKTKDDEHDISHFFDPVSGEYWLQNYGKLVNTHETTLHGLLDISARLIGPLTSLALVESQPGRVHQYEPRTARWVRQVLEGRALRRPEQALVEVRIGNPETGVALEGGARLAPEIALKAFFTNRSFLAPDGSYVLTGLGLAGESEGRLWLNSPGIDELGAALIGYGGVHYLSLPIVDPSPPETGQRSHGKSSLFGGGRLQGWARFRSLTTSVEAYLSAIDVDPERMDGSPPLHRLTLSASYALSASGLTLSTTRVFEVVPRTIHQAQRINHLGDSHRLATVHDRLLVDYRVEGFVGRLRLTERVEFTVFEGLESSAALGLRNRLECCLDSAIGQWRLLIDLGSVITNPSGDPFYTVPMNASGRLDWQLPLVDHLLLGTALQLATPNRTPHLFEDPEEAEPHLGRITTVVEARLSLFLRMQL